MFWKKRTEASRPSRRVPRLRRHRAAVERLEDRLTPAPLTFAVIGDYGVGGSAYNAINVLLGTPDPAGDVSRLAHGWNPDFLMTLGDNNYLVGEQFDVNLLLDLQLGVATGKIGPSTMQSALDRLSLVPASGLSTVVTGRTTQGSNVLTGLSSTSGLSVGMVVYGAGVPFPSGPDSPFLPTVTSIDSSTSVTLSLNATSTVGRASLTFMPGNVNLGQIDGLSNIDRNIGRYYSDFIHPYVTSSPHGQFGVGSPTGFNRMFPVPGNHDWADIDSDGGTSLVDKEASLALGYAQQTCATWVSARTLTVASAAGLAVGMTVLGPNLPSLDPSNPLSILLLPRIEAIDGDTITLNRDVPSALVPDSTLVFLPIFDAEGRIVPGNMNGYLNFFAGLNPSDSPGLTMGTTLVNGVETPIEQPYFYSFTVGDAGGGRPLIEFFAFDSELADPYLTGEFTGGSFENFTNVDTINSQEGQWLKRAMGRSRAVWQIPYFHHTPYTSAGEGDAGAFTGQWMQLPFQQWGADAVMYGHVHVYERLSKADPAIPALGMSAGTFEIPYLLNGLGGAPSEPFDGPTDPGSQRRYNGDFGAQRMTADQNSFSFEFINRSGAIIDTYSIVQPLVAVGANKGGPPIVSIVNANTGGTLQTIQAYEKGFIGGVRVAMGDLNDDGVPELVTAPGRGRSGQIKAYDGLTGQLLPGFESLTPYGGRYSGGIFVATGDIDGKPGAEIVVSAQSGARPVMAFTRSGMPLPGFTPFLPYGGGFTGGVTVAIGDTTGTGPDEIITAPFSGARPVQVLDAAGAVLLSTSPYGAKFRSGIFVAAGDIDGDGMAEIIVGPVSGGQPARILDGQSGVATSQISPFGARYRAGIRVGTLDLDRDGTVDVLYGRGDAARVSTLLVDPLTGRVIKSFSAARRFGAFIAGY